MASKIDELTTQLMEHFCDKLCVHPRQVEDQEWLDDICAECKAGELVIGILNEDIRLRALAGEEVQDEAQTDGKE